MMQGDDMTSDQPIAPDADTAGDTTETTTAPGSETTDGDIPAPTQPGGM